MTNQFRHANIWLGTVIFATILGLAALKFLYIGVRQIPVGIFGSHKIVFSWTWNSLDSIIDKDGRSGYYRIYNKDGQKVYELFSDTYAIDIVHPREKEVEFLLDTGLDTEKSVFWPPRDTKIQSEQAAPSNR